MMLRSYCIVTYHDKLHLIFFDVVLAGIANGPTSRGYRGGGKLRGGLVG